MTEAEPRRPRSTRRSKRLLQAWFVIALVWIAAAGWESIAPVDRLLSQARAHQVVIVKPAPVNPNGPLPAPPDSPAVAAAKVIARQAAIMFGPPFLLLWFGWDLWFAAAGILELRLKRRAAASGRDEGADRPV